MTPSKDERIRAAIAEQAADWLVAADAGPLDPQDSAALVAWLKASPVHVEEFLRVAVISRDLNEAAAGLGSVDALIARAQANDDRPGLGYWPRALAAVRTLTVSRWQIAVVTMAAVIVVGLGLLWLPKLEPVTPASAPSETLALHFSTRHGEQRTQRLADNSVLHLNTDTAITVRYSKTERLVVLDSGEADFQVAHERDRPFRVSAGPAQAIAHGTQFDVRLKSDSAVVTVIEGQVGVEPSRLLRGRDPGRQQALRLVELHADEQIVVSRGEWPVAPKSVDASRTTAWLHGELAFDHEPLEQVAAEFNRYAAKPIEIAAPELRNLEISGTFSTDDSEEFIAFLRSLAGIQVEETATQVRVSKRPSLRRPVPKGDSST